MVKPDKVIGSSEMGEIELNPKKPTPDDARADAEAARSAPEVVRVAVESMPRVEVRVEGGVPPLPGTAQMGGAASRLSSEDFAAGSPIGALPGAAQALQAIGFAKVLVDAKASFAMIRRGLREITTALVKLAWLPVTMAFLAMRKLRPLKV